MNNDALLWNAPAPPPPKPRPAQRLWTMQKHGKQVDADLRQHDGWGFECQFLYNGDFVYGRRWVTRDAALLEAESKRVELSLRGWQDVPGTGVSGRT
jgi:hypothetical protein